MADVIRMTIEAKLYYGTAGSTAATEVTNIVGDLTQTIAPDGAEITERGQRYKVYAPGQVDSSLSWTSNWRDANTFLQACQTAFLTGISMAFRTKDYSSGKGWDADFIVTKFDKKEGASAQQTVDIEIKPTSIAGRYPNAYV